MAVAFRSASSFNSGAGTSNTASMTQPAGAVAGDVVVINCGTNATVAGAVFTATGFSTVPGFTPQTQGNTCSQYLLYRVLDGTESWPITLSSTATVRITGNVGAWSGVDPNNPFAGVQFKANAAATAASFTAATPQAESVYAVLFVRARNATATSTVTANSTGYTLEADTCTTSTSFNQAAILDQHTVYGLPLAVPAIANSTLSQSSNQVNTVLFLRADISAATTLTTDTLIGVNNLASGAASASFSTGYAETLVLFINIAANDTVASVSNTSGLTWTKKVGIADGTFLIATEVWYAYASTALSNQTFTVTTTGASPTSSLLVTFANGNSSTPLGASNTGDVSGVPSLSLTTTANNSWVWGALASGNGTTGTAGTAQTVEVTQTFTGTQKGQTQKQNAVTATSGTSVTINQATSRPYTMAIVEVVPVAAAPVTATGSTLLMMGV